jgi:hypothetical protein
VIRPKYPVYVISKGRHDCCLTANFMVKDGMDFNVVVEPQEAQQYIDRYGSNRVHVLPFSNLGLGSIPARNWCWEHAKAAGHERHWIFDDNIRYIEYRYKGLRLRCDSNAALAAAEVFVSRYADLAILGLNYSMFVPDRQKMKPFAVNVHVYSCLCIDNSIPQRWRGRYNEDTDLCLQVISAGLNTALLNVFTIKKIKTLTMKGGNMSTLYQGDGRLKMAKSLERLWPYVVTTERRWERPQHKVRDEWKTLKTALKLKPGVTVPPGVDNFGLTLTAVADVQSERLQKMVAEAQKQRQ